jgi:F-type H+-transporting ATPase subunit epsilon
MADAKTMQVELVSPEKVLFSGEAVLVVCRPEGGDAAFLPGHAPFLGLLGIGPVTIRPPQGADIRAAVHGGFVQVSENKVTILSDVAELASDIDVDRAKAAQTRAESPSAQRRAATRLLVTTG